MSAHACGLAPFLTFLGSFPEPASVARAVAGGPLAPLGARSCVIMCAHEDVELRLLSSFGSTDAANDRFGIVSLRLDVPMVNAYLESRVVVHTVGDFFDGYPATALDAALWDEVAQKTGPGLVVEAPVSSEGTVVGTMTAVLTDFDEGGPDDLALVDGVCAALGLWVTHPRSRVERKMRSFEAVGEEHLDLTPRQLQILLLVEQGKSNAAIAATLGFSDSTVKQDVQRVMRILRADDRHEAVHRAREIGLLT